MRVCAQTRKSAKLSFRNRCEKIEPVCSNAMGSKKEFRGYIPSELNRLVRALSALKNGGRDWSLSDVLTEALQDWVQKPENQALVEKHNLDTLKVEE